MSRRAIAVVAGVALLAACGDNGSSSAAQPSTTSTTSTTTTSEDVSIYGLLDPPDGYTQNQADAFAVDVVEDLAAAGWPDLGVETTTGVLQIFLLEGAFACEWVELSDSAEVPFDAVDDIESTLTGLGADPATASQLTVAGHDATLSAAGEHLCPGRL